MTTTATARFAEVYRRGIDTAVVVHTTAHKVRLRRIAHRTTDSSEFTLTRAQLARDWQYTGTLPTLTCVSRVAANQAARWLAEQGTTVVFADGYTVAADLDAAAAARFVDHVRRRHWAYDADCDRMIEGLG